MAVSTIDPNGLNIGQIGGRRNLVINGEMQVSQRGDFTSASSASNSTYYVDRWIAVVTTVTANKQHVLNTTYGNSFLLTATSTGTGRLGIVQRMETQPYMLNTTVTLSCWVKSNNANARLYIYNDVDGMNTSSTHTGDGTWQKLTMSLALTNGWTNFEVSSRIMSSTNGNVSITSGDYIETTQVQLELGDVATPFEHRSYAEELSACKRYFERLNFLSTDYVLQGQTGGSSTTANGLLYYTEKRTAPTVTLPSAGTSSGTITFLTPTGGYPSSVGSHTIQVAGPKQCRVYGSGYSGLTAGRNSILFSTGTNSVDVDAEL